MRSHKGMGRKGGRKARLLQASLEAEKNDGIISLNHYRREIKIATRPAQKREKKVVITAAHLQKLIRDLGFKRMTKHQLQQLLQNARKSKSAKI